MPVRVRNVLRAREPVPRPGHDLRHSGPRRRLLLPRDVSIEHAVNDVLARLSDAQVEALAAACDSRQRPDAGLTQIAAGASPGAHDAIAELASAWAARPLLTGNGVALALALRVGLRARREADTRRSRAVWTGPGATGGQRLTAAVLHELVTDARERILLVSFAAYTLTELAADLEAAVRRGCQVDVVFETEQDSRRRIRGSRVPTVRQRSTESNAGAGRLTRGVPEPCSTPRCSSSMGAAHSSARQTSPVVRLARTSKLASSSRTATLPLTSRLMSAV